MIKYNKPTTIYITAQVKDKWYKPKREVKLVLNTEDIQPAFKRLLDIDIFYPEQYCKKHLDGYVAGTVEITRVKETKVLELTDKQYRGVMNYRMRGDRSCLATVARELGYKNKGMLNDYINGAEYVDIKVIEKENTMEYLELTQEQRDAVVTFKKGSEWPVSALMARKNDNQYIQGTDAVRALVSKLDGNKERLLLRYLGNDERVGIKVVNPVKTFYYEAGEKVILNGREVTLTKDTIVEFKGE